MSYTETLEEAVRMVMMPDGQINPAKLRKLRESVQRIAPASFTQVNRLVTRAAVLPMEHPPVQLLNQVRLLDLFEVNRRVRIAARMQEADPPDNQEQHDPSNEELAAILAGIRTTVMSEAQPRVRNYIVGTGTDAAKAAANGAFHPLGPATAQQGDSYVDANGLYQQLLPGYRQTFNAVAKTMQDRFNIPSTRTDTAVRTYLMHAASNVQGINETTRTALQDLLIKAWHEGWTESELSDQIQSDFAFSQARADSIVDTEYAAATNHATMAVARAANKPMMVRVTDGELYDQACQEMNGKVLTLDQAAQVPVLQHPHCRRHFIPFVATEAEDEHLTAAVKPTVPHVGTHGFAADLHPHGEHGHFTTTGEHLKVGGRVMHPKYGPGTVKHAPGELHPNYPTETHVKFDNGYESKFISAGKLSPHEGAKAEPKAEPKAEVKVNHAVADWPHVLGYSATRNAYIHEGDVLVHDKTGESFVVHRSKSNGIELHGAQGYRKQADGYIAEQHFHHEDDPAKIAKAKEAAAQGVKVEAGVKEGKTTALEPGSYHDAGGDKEKAEAWARAEYGGTGKEVSLNDGQFIYKMDGYAPINSYFRTGHAAGMLADTGKTPTASEVETYAKDIDKKFKPLKHGVAVYRATDIPGAEKFKPGTVFQDKGYVSTNAYHDPEGAGSGGSLDIKIKVPKGKHAQYLGDQEGMGEREVLLPRNTQFKVVSIKGHEMELEVVG